MNERFLELYDHIVCSKDQNKMHVLGNVVKDMMSFIVSINKVAAEEFINKLEAVKWNNYLTKQEANDIVLKMQPAPKWSRQAWESMMDLNKWPLENAPFYNQEALFVTMQMISSDSGETIQHIINEAGTAATPALFEMAVYKLALDKLTDKDKMFNIRKYFNV